MQSGNTPASPAQVRGITPLEAVRIVLRRKLLIIGMTLTTAILSVAYSLTLPNIYSASAKVLPPKGESSGLSALLGQVGGGLGSLAGGGGKGGDSDLYVGILNSRSLADAVIEKLGLRGVYKIKSHDEMRRYFHGMVDVQTGKDGIITVSVQDRDPKLAALIANSCVDELGRASVRLNLTKAGAEKYFLEKRLEITRKDLRNAEEDLKLFCERNHIVQPEGQTGVAMTGAAALKSNIANMEVQLEVLRRTQTEESAEVKSMVTAIAKMKADLARTLGNNGVTDGFPSLGSVPNVGLAYSRKLREVQLQAAVFEQLTKQYEVAKLNDSRDTSSVQVLDPAVVPEVKSKPQRSMIVLFSTLVAFLVSTLLSLALEYHRSMPDEQRKVVEDLKRLAFSLR